MKLHSHPTRRRLSARLSVRMGPLMLALCSAGYMSAALAAPDIAADTLPSGMTLKNAVNGTASVEVVGNTMTATQSASRAVWEATNFSVGSAASFVNNATSASSLTLIRVIKGDSMFGMSSVINGSVTANNNLMLVNPFGIYVGGTARLNVGSLVLSARDLDSSLIGPEGDYEGFMKAGHIVFNTGSGNYAGNVISGYGNYGDGVVDIDPEATLTATDGGSILLIGDQGVRNQGLIQVLKPGGVVALVAAGSTEVDVGDSGFITLSNFDGDISATRVALNTGTINAPNGTVTLGGAGDAFGSSVFGQTVPMPADTLPQDGTQSGAYNSGTIMAQSGPDGQGKVSLVGKGYYSAAVNTGTVDVSVAKGAQGLGGLIQMSAHNVMVGAASEGRAQLLAEGTTGGGQITLDNTTAEFDGESSTLIYVASGSLLSADATANGQGGQITLSSLSLPDEAGMQSMPGYSLIAAYGTLRARGGLDGGNGGTVQTFAQNVSTHNGELQATIDVSARASGFAGGLWSLYSPGLIIGSAIPGQGLWYQPGTSGTYVTVDDINAVLDQGASVKMSTYHPASDLGAGYNLTVERGTRFVRGPSEGGSLADNQLTLQSGHDIYVGAGSQFASNAGKMGIVLQADADGDGHGSLLMGDVLQDTFLAPLSLARVSAQAVPVGESSVIINSNGADVTLTGAGAPAGATSDAALTDYSGVLMYDTHINSGGGKITIKGSGGSTSGDIASQNGVTIDTATITGGEVQIVGHSTSATGVALNRTTITTETGTIAISGVSQGGGQVGVPIGVDIGSEVQINMGQGRATILGRAADGAGGNAVGVRINDLLVTTAGGLSNPAQLFTLVGQSVGSSAPGIRVDGEAQGLRMHDIEGEGLSASADIVIGGSADAQADQALALQDPSWDTTGRVNFRPLGLTQDESGVLTPQEQFGTTIRVGYDSGGQATNFVVAPNWFNQAENGQIAPSVGTVIGSSGHTGLISVADNALSGASAVTLQNQGAGSAGIELGGQGSMVQALNLVTSGPIKQVGGPIVVNALRVIADAQSLVQLNVPNNQITSLSYSGVASPDVKAQALPAASSAQDILGYDTGEQVFQALAITAAPNEGGPDVIPPGFDDVSKDYRPFEGPEALNDLRTDVYVHGQVSRPQVCTAANTAGSAQVLESELDPLSLEWVKVRRSAQLSNCSGVRADSNCAAF